MRSEVPSMSADELENFRALFQRRFDYALQLQREAHLAEFRGEAGFDLKAWAADVLVADSRQLLQNLNEEIARKQRHSL